MSGQSIERTATLMVAFDVEVIGVNEATFSVRVRSTQTPLAAVVDYFPGDRLATLNVPGGMPESEQLDMVLTEAIVDPVTQNPLVEGPISFATTMDTRAPKVDFADPQDGAAGLSVLTEVFLRFDENVTGVSTSTVTITAGSPVVAMVSYSAGQRSALLRPTNQLAPNTLYTVSAGAGIFDESSNPLVPFTMTFMTGDDFVEPSIRVTNPAPGATGVAVGANVVVTFDEPVMNVSAANFQLNNGAIAGTITQQNDGRTIVFDPTGNLPAASTIGVSLGSTITDLSGNPLATNQFNFATQ